MTIPLIAPLTPPRAAPPRPMVELREAPADRDRQLSVGALKTPT
jgi:hypothetical protein